MDTSRIGSGEQVAAASGLALIAFMFLPWYGETAKMKGLPAGLGNTQLSAYSGWESFGPGGYLLLLLAVAVAVGSVFLHANGTTIPAPILVGAGMVAVLLVVVRILYAPLPDSELFPGVTVAVGHRVGIVLGLVAAVGVAIGGVMEMRERSQISKAS